MLKKKIRTFQNFLEIDAKKINPNFSKLLEIDAKKINPEFLKLLEIDAKKINKSGILKILDNGGIERG